MTIIDGITILAIILGPILAVQAQKFIERFRERHNRQLYIFRTLMHTRNTNLSPEHVSALNLIDTDFSKNKKKEKNIISAWEELHDQYNNYPQRQSVDDDTQYNQALSSAADKSSGYLITLLHEMSKYLGYDFDKTHIKNGCYTPVGHIDIENEQRALRQGLISLMSGRNSLNMNVLSLPEQAPHDSASAFLETSAKNQKETLDILKQIATGETKISVSISQPEPNIDKKNKPLSNKA